MDWTQVLFLFFGHGALTVALIAWLRADMKDFHSEMKDFHGRMCTLEERYINWLTKQK